MELGRLDPRPFPVAHPLTGGVGTPSGGADPARRGHGDTPTRTTPERGLYRVLLPGISLPDHRYLSLVVPETGRLAGTARSAGTDDPAGAVLSVAAYRRGLSGRPESNP